MRTTTIVAAVLMAAASVAAAATPVSTAKGVQSPSAFPILDSARSQGCFSTQGELQKIPTPDFMSMGSCTKKCIEMGKLVSGLHGSDCLCGDTYPPPAALVEDKFCNYPCPGYDPEACGGIGTKSYWSIFNNGLKLDVKTGGAAPSDTDSANSPSGTAPQSTVVVTEVSNPSSGPSVGGIVGGVIVAILAVVAIICGVFFYLRRKRNKEVEDEHRRNAAVNAFINGAKPPSSSGGLSMTDSRLDPVMAHRRMSDGSIADNQDYSRKILRVTNA